MDSSVTEKNIKELREAGYLAKEIAHRLPVKKQIIPTLKPVERVVFIPHFLRGPGFPFILRGPVRKLPNVTWPKGTFVEIVKG